MRRVVGAKLLRANGRKAPPCVFLFPARFFCCQPRFFVRQHPRSAVLVLAFPLPARFFCCKPRCFVRQHPRSVAFLLAFLRSPRFFCCATALSVRHHPLSRLFFLIGRRERLCSAKNLCPPACAPRRYRARGATVFGFSLARFRLAAPFFLLKIAVFSRLEAEFPCRCAGFSVRRGCASLALMQVFATSCGALGLRAALSRFSAPLLGCRSPLRLRSLRSGGKYAPIFHLSTICFPQSFPRCGENVHLPVCFSPPFRFSSAGRTDPLPPKGGKVPFTRAYI